MLWHRIRGLWNAYHALLAVILTLVFWLYLAMVFFVFRYPDVQASERFILYNLAAVVGLAVAAIRGRGSAATMLAGGFVDCHTVAFRQTAYIGVTILVVMLAAVDPPGSRVLKALLFGFLLSVYVVFLICHLFLPRKLADQLFSKAHEQRTLLIGPVDKAREMAKWIEETAAFRFGVRGSVIDDDEREDARVLHVTRVSDVLMLERIIKHEGIKQILLLELPLDEEGLDLVVGAANKAGVCLHVVNNLSEIFRHDITFYSLHSRDFISLRNQPLEDPVNRILKRTVDVLVSVPIVIFILPPLCILVKIFQAIQSPGPLFHRETRAGLAFRPFRIFMFRTTRVHKDDDASTHGDRRVYPMGQLLRTTGLDKMPQFLNVFFDAMSVVGPQPNTPIQNRRFSEIMDQYHVRTFAKPGITGLAQVSGYRGEARTDEDVAESAKLDIRYIETWSLPLDLSIMFKTFYQVLKPPKTAC